MTTPEAGANTPIDDADLMGQIEQLQDDNITLCHEAERGRRFRRWFLIATIAAVSCGAAAAGTTAWALHAESERSHALERLASKTTAETQNANKVTEAKKRVQALEAEKAAMSKDLDRRERTIKETQATLDRVTAQRDDAVAARDQATAARDQAITDRDQAVAEAEGKDGQIQELTDTVDELRTKNAEAEQYISEMEDYVDHLEQRGDD